MEKTIRYDKKNGFFGKWNKSSVAQMEDAIQEVPYEMVEIVADSQKQIEGVVYETLLAISETINNIDIASEEMAKSTVIQANEVQDINVKLAGIGATVDNTFTCVDSLANGYERVLQCSTQGCEMLTELKEISVETQKSIEAVRKQTDATNISSAKIKNATALINGIAHQTNLLSLNASIEAARSGESGKGFAVVASEIRKLADQSQNIATQITQIVNALIENSNSSVEIMTTVTESINRQNDKLNSTNDVFNELVSEMGGVSETVENVTLAMIDLEELKGEVVDNVFNLTTFSEENAARSEEISASIQEMNQKLATCLNS